MTSLHSLRRGLPGYLIPFTPHAFASQRQESPSDLLSPLVFLAISMDFTPTPQVPVASNFLNSYSIPYMLLFKKGDLIGDL